MYHSFFKKILYFCTYSPLTAQNTHMEAIFVSLSAGRQKYGGKKAHAPRAPFKTTLLNILTNIKTKIDYGA